MNISAPITQAVDNKRREVMIPYALTFDRLTVEIARGFIFDGGSIPRVLWRLIGHPFQGLGVPAFIVHDALYRTHLVSKEEADKIFYRLLVLNDVWKPKAKAMYLTVKYFGGSSWRQYGESTQIFNRYFVKLKRKGGDNAKQ